MFLNDSHFIDYIFFIKFLLKEKGCQNVGDVPIYIGHHVNVNLDAFVKMEARMFFSHMGCLHMDGDRKWFWSP
jgi:hypothetical protein